MAQHLAAPNRPFFVANLRNSGLIRAIRALTWAIFHHNLLAPELIRGSLITHKLQLCPGGVAHLDDRPDATAPFSWFQSESHWTAPSLVVEEMAGAGYQRLSEFDFLPVQSFQIFRPETSQEASRVSELNDSPEEGVGS